jgi:hypothetical protein
MNEALDSAPKGYLPVSLKYGPYSPSRLIVARCPARFQSKYIFKDKIVSDAIAASRGNAIHEVLKKITEHKVSETPVTTVILNEWVSAAVGKYPAAYDQIQMVKEAASAYAGNPCPYVNKSTLCEQAFSIKMYQEDSFSDDTVKPVAYVKTEYSSDAQGRNLNKEAYFGVKLDQLHVDHETKIVTIVDHKSTPSANANADHTFQLGCYAWVASLYYPGYSIRTVLHYAHPRLNFYAAPVDWEWEDLMLISQEIHTRISAIESFEEFPALPGSHCDYCHMVQDCPELRTIQVQNSRGDINLNVHTVDDMIRVARQLRVTGVLYDQLNKKLKEAIETNCPESGIAIEGMWIGFKVGDEKVDWVATDRKIKDTANGGSLDSILKKHGLDPAAFKEWRGEKLRSLWKLQNDGLIEDLKEFVVKVRDTRFGMYKT